MDRQPQRAARLSLIIAVAVIGALLTACGSGGNSSPTPTGAAPATQSPAASPTPELSGSITVFAASSLTDAFNQEATAFKKAHPKVTVTFNFGGSPALVTQLDQGAPADVLATADEKNMTTATQKALVSDPVKIFAKNRLAIAVPKSNPGQIQAPKDLAKANLKLVLTQKGVPVGDYARQALSKMEADATFGAGFSDKVLKNLVSEEPNVKAVVAKVQLGEADAGIVYKTDITAGVAKDIATVDIPDPFNVVASYPIAVATKSAKPDIAAAFVDFVLAPDGQKILTDNGFIAVPPAPTSFRLSGLVNAETEVKLADLQALPKSDVTTTPLTGTGSLGEHKYSGALVYDLLQHAGLKFGPSNTSDALTKGIVISGNDGYQVIVSWAEIDPKFAAEKVLLAYEKDGALYPAGSGIVELVVPTDKMAGRYVYNIVSIEVADLAPNAAKGDRKPATSISVRGLVNGPIEVDAAKLATLTQTSVTVTDKDGKSTVFRGVLLTDVLQSAGGMKVDPAHKNDVLRKAVVAAGTDGYTAVVADGEIDAKFGGVQVLIATSVDGQPLATADGFAQLVVPSDGSRGRFVTNLASLEMVSLK
jgi:molybdate transport system substrate-binding protein